jgi:hypothetical protein
MHARRIDRAHTGAARAALTANPVLRSAPLWPEVGTPHRHTGASLNAVPLSICPDMSPQTLRPRGPETAARQRTASKPAQAQLNCAAPILPGAAFTSSTLRAINAHVAVAYSSVLVF